MASAAAVAAETSGAAEMAEGLAAAEGVTLPRGTGLLILLHSSWAGKGRTLPTGRATVGSLSYSHYTIGCLISKEGVLMKNNQPLIRVAHEFLADTNTAAAAGLWSAKSFSVTVEPFATLLLAAKPLQLIPKRFKASTPGYMALYGEGLSEQSISAALGE